MNFKSKITELHYNKDAKGFLFNILKFASIFYGLGSSFKNYLYDYNLIKPQKVDAFVISVGNFTTGGVGKTPVVAEIAKYFVNKEEKVAIVSRGYGGKLNNKNVNVISDGINLYHKADMAGDEPYWLAVNLNMCAVLTCADRYKACKYAVEKLGATKIILDDGFQYRKLHRDLNIVLIDSEKQFGNQNLLPAGPLRERTESFKRIDKIVVVSKSTEHNRAEKYARILEKKQSIKTYLCKTEPDYTYNTMSGEILETKKEVIAMSAIGQPEQFYNFVEKFFTIKKKLTFDDHHKYNYEDIANYKDEIIVTTEKDAVKLTLLEQSNIFALKLKIDLDVESLLN